MSTSTVVYSFDKLAVKLLLSYVLLEIDPSTKIWILSDQMITELQLGEAFKEGTTFVAMQALVFGNNPLKKNEPKSDCKLCGLDKEMLWKDYFMNWRNFKGFNPKLLVVSDVFEILLTMFYDDDYFIGSYGKIL